ncbi:MAG: YhdH/YhfP family quinone oxidoreductase [Gracilimonas sp.]|uniref:YhdH/YhfP family quinone oxidoreductase n=1 Tax=Gracilimonas sp. TaxID=1974203 RepID=UPI001991F845|nr:YhdH/YhfP family quinone oxidoreductase [Gracilimonas sp.]MBD3617328.1 YhdH/YhfP family quinone oxidoreductase [Gracilimonas sp.]
MSGKTFKAFLVEENSEGNFSSNVTEVPVSFLPDHEVLIQVQFSSLNYKDALSASGNKGVTRNYPHIPGIDAAGTVVEDSSGFFKEGQKVIVTGQDLGSNTPGGFGQLIRVPKEWVVRLPSGLDLEISMKYGTAGFTAMYGIKRLQRELISPQDGKVLVTGATGGVGSLAVFFLSELGYEVVAATGKTDKADFLEELGAAEVIHRDKITDVKDSFLLSREWNGAIETVGGKMLDAVIRQTNHDGAVACCGNILGHELKTSIYPFILRGVSLLGIDSAICKMPMRLKIWESIAAINHKKLPDDFSKKVNLKGLQEEVETILKGQQSGRVVVEHK